MQTVRLVNGKLFFDDFDSSTLNSKWELVPNAPLRYSLVERPGYLKLFHGTPDIMMLTNEPDSFVLDIRNDYVPVSDSVKSGIVVFKSLNEKLEILEYYDVNKQESFVYEFIRLEKTKDIYTAYGRNKEGNEWELIGSGEFKSAGKLGIIVKGPAISGSSDFNLDYFKLYASHKIKILNVPVGYKVRLLDANHNSLALEKVLDSMSGVEFTTETIPPFSAYFRIYDELENIVHESGTFDVWGGDVYYYGAMPVVTIDGRDLKQDGEYFLGYFSNGIINFKVDIFNPYPNNFGRMKIVPVQYGQDIGYEFVTFSTSIDGTYSSEVILDSLNSGDTTSIYGKITRDSSLQLSSIEPFKFNLAVEF